MVQALNPRLFILESKARGVGILPDLRAPGLFWAALRYKKARHGIGAGFAVFVSFYASPKKDLTLSKKLSHSG